MKSWMLPIIPMISLGSRSTAQTSANVSEGIGQWVERASMIARIQTGIALQAGLMKGEISADEGIAELMNFGPLTLSRLVELKKDRLEDLMNMLKQVKLDSSTDASEKQMIQLDHIRERSALIGPLTGYSNNSELFLTAAQLINDTEKLVGLGKALNETIGLLKTAGTFDDQQIGYSGFSILEQLHAGFKKLRNESKPTQELETKLSEYSNSKLETQHQTLKPLEMALQLMEHRMSMPSVKLLPDAMVKVYDVVNKLIVAAKSASADFSIVNDLVTHRFHPHKHARKFTIGFRNGASDLKLLAGNLFDSWIEKMFGSGENLNRLKNGLRPLFSLVSKLEGVDDKLKTVSTEAAYEAVSSIYQLQQAMEKTDATVEDVSEVVTAFDSCHSAAPQNVPSSAFNPVRQLIKDAKLLPSTVQTSKHTVQSVIDSLDTLLKESAELQRRIEETKSLKNIDEIKNKSAVIYKEFLTSEKVPKLLLPYENLKKIIGEFFSSRSVFESVTDGAQRVAMFLKDNQKELDLYSCLQKMNEKSEKVAQAFQVAQKLRKIVVDEVENFRTTVSTTMQASDDIALLKGISGDLESATRAETEFLNKMEKAVDHSRAVGLSTDALWNMAMLVAKKPFIAMLKANKDFVAELIDRVSDPETKATLAAVWKDHEKRTTSMDSEVKKIEGLDATGKQVHVDTLDVFGALFKELKAVRSVDYKIDEELLVVATLTALTSNVSEQEQLLRLRDALRKFAVLDLNFTSAHSAFDEAPASYAALFAYIHSGTNEPFALPVWALIVASCVLILILLAVLGLIFYCFIYPYFKTPDEVNIYYWIKRQKRTNAAAEKRYKKILAKLARNTQIDEAASRAYLPVSKMRDPQILCNPRTAVSVTKRNGAIVPVHANLFTTGSNLTFIATQAPMDGSQPGKDDTREDFIDLIVQQGSKFVVMLCKFEETNARCPKYAPEEGESVSIGRYWLTTVSAQVIHQGDVVSKYIRILDRTGVYPMRFIRHLQMTTWLEDFFPETPHVIVNMLKDIIQEQSETPIIVHCMTGVGRTVSFIAVEILTAEVAKNSMVSIKKVFNQKIREIRWHGVQHWFDLYYVQIATVYKLCVRFNLDRRFSFEQTLEIQKIYDLRMDAEQAILEADPEYQARVQAEREEIRRIRHDQYFGADYEERQRQIVAARGENSGPYIRAG